MAGLKLYRELQDLEEEANRLGFMFAHYRFNYEADVIALQPMGEQLPTYSRDAQVFAGTHIEVRNFLQGVKWARGYDNMIGAMSDRRRAQYEAREVARLERIRYNKARAETFQTLKKEHA